MKMSKELEALNKIQHDFGQLKGQELVKCYEIIFNGLKRLEAIDNANPSEALNYLDQFINEMTKCLENPKQYAKNYDKEIFYKYKYTFETTIKQSLLKAQEQEKENAEYKKVLEIIKKKNIEMYWLKHSKTVEEYNKHIKNLRDTFKLTQEEFDLLKRWVNGQK